jgi:predicted DNA-binding transcriptional regulator AlpA
MPTSIASPEDEAAWNVQDVMAFLRTSRNTIGQWIKQGKLPPPRKVGRNLLWPPAEIRALLQKEGGSRASD